MQKRLYVLSRKDLTYSSSAVQAGHALAEFLLRGPTDLTQQWNNHTLIFLGVKNINELNKYCFQLDKNDIKWIGFNEPDLNNELTAIATIVEDGKLFSKLRLLT